MVYIVTIHVLKHWLIQRDSVKRLQIEDYIVEWYTDKGVTHGEYGPNRDNFVISQIQNIFSI